MKQRPNPPHPLLRTLATITGIAIAFQSVIGALSLIDRANAAMQAPAYMLAGVILVAGVGIGTLFIRGAME